MKITIKHLTTPTEIAEFWQKKHQYQEQDIFPNLGETGAERAEIIAWFNSQEYYDLIMELHNQPQGGGAPLQFVFFFDDDEQYLGFAMYKIYTQEDGKGFILDFCIDKKRRNHGLGAQVFRALEQQLLAEGATYMALNTSNQDNTRFWLRQGFIPLPPDEDGEIVYTKHI